MGSFHFLEDYPGEVAETKNHKFLNKLELHTPNPSRLTTLQRASNRKFRLQSSPAQKDDAAVHFWTLSIFSKNDFHAKAASDNEVHI